VPTSSHRYSGANQHAEDIAFAKAEFRAAETDDARNAWLHHLDDGTWPKAKLFEPVNVVRAPDDLRNFAALASFQLG